MAEGDGTKYGKYVVSDLRMPESKQKIDADYRKYARRILWLDDTVVEGAFHMNTAWYLKPGPTLESRSHTHDTDEIIGFFGSDPENPTTSTERWRSGWRTRSTSSIAPR